MRRRLAVAGCCLSLSLSLALWGEQGWLALKARVAEALIARAWQAHLGDGERHRPWSWADTYPLARLGAPRLGVERTVLAGASGSSLAFGPGHVDGTAAPNARGNCVVAGHRDTDFRFLGELAVGDTLWLEDRGGRVAYRVREIAVRSMWDVSALSVHADERRLTLVTCWPLDALVSGPQRLVVVAAEAAADRASAAMRFPNRGDDRTLQQRCPGAAESHGSQR